MSLSAASCRHTHIHTQPHVFLHMHRYGSHQVWVKGLPHYPAPAKTFGVFYALVSIKGGGGEEEGGTRGYRKNKIMKKTDVILGGNKRRESE